MAPSKDFNNGVRVGRQDATLENVRADIAEFREEWKEQHTIVTKHSESITWLRRAVIGLYTVVAGCVGMAIKLLWNN